MKTEETNLEKAKRLLTDNAYIQGIELKENNYLFKMLDLAATPDTVKENKLLHKGVGKCCENPNHKTEINYMFESWVICKNCNREIL